MDRTTQRHVLGVFSAAPERESHNLPQRPELLWQQLYNRLPWIDSPSLDDLDEPRRPR